MKNISIIILVSFLFAGCKKDYNGKVNYAVQYSASNHLRKAPVNMNTKNNIYYTQFGDFITSVTPSSFMAKINLLRLYGNSTNDGLLSMMTLIGPTHGLGDFNADFSNNAKVFVTPALSGNMVNGNSDGTGGYLKDVVVFKLLLAGIQNLKQVAELPVQFNGVNISQFNQQYFQNRYFSDSVKNGNILTIDMFPLIANVNVSVDIFKRPMDFYFGLIDSTALYNTNDPITQPASLLEGNNYFEMIPPLIWSNKFNQWTYEPPVNSETISIVCTISFDTDNLIQIYAGADNIPYTQDDIFIYAPYFWERISIEVQSN